MREFWGYREIYLPLDRTLGGDGKEGETKKGKRGKNGKGWGKKLDCRVMNVPESSRGIGMKEYRKQDEERANKGKQENEA